MNEAVEAPAPTGSEGARRADAAATASVDRSIRELAVDGFCVIRDFLPPAAVEAVVDDYRARGASENTNYQIGLASDGAIGIVRERVAELAGRVASSIGIRTDFEGLHQGYYFDTQVLTFNSWHQDAESQYMLGTHADYLNFYIPVVKPVRDKTNVQVIPASRIRDRAPQAWSRIENGGGTICHVVADGGSTVVFDESGERVVLPFDINELCVTPELGEGDLLLMRGDTFHRTQDADTARVALSLRLANPECRIRLRDLASGSSKKVNLMAGNWSEFGPAFEVLGRSANGEMPWSVVRLAIENGGDDAVPTLGRAAARRRILREKVRQGTVLDTVRREIGYRRTRRRYGI